MNKYDLHMHTTESWDSTNKPEVLLKLAKKRGLTGIAITDHNKISGGEIVKKLNKDKDFEVIVGEEVSTNFGDVLGLYLHEQINKRDFFEVIDEIKKQGGIIIIPHPFRAVPWAKFKYPLDKLQGKIDAIEVFNSRNLWYSNIKAAKVVNDLDFAIVGSSDAHVPFDIARGYTIFEGDLRNAIKNKSTTAHGSTLLGVASGAVAMFRKRVMQPLGIK